MASEWQDRLDAACEAAKKAGAFLKDIPSFSVEHKAANDYVTDADRQSEEMIRSFLLERYPSDGFLGEEESETSGRTGRWIVDPIDGTTNFVKGLPLYTVSIAYETQGRIVAGCVYCPPLDEMYTAMEGQGACLNGKPMHTSGNPVLRDAVVGMSFAHRHEDAGKRMMHVLPAMRSALSDMRRLGSAALDLCFVACGRYDAFLELHLYLYDIAAGALIVREAGGIVTSWPGDKEKVEENGNVFAASAAIYGGLYDMIARAEGNGETLKPDAIIVLGHRLNPDNTPSDDLKRRIDKTVEYWKETGCPVVMPCGGKTRGRTRTEAEVMKEMLLERGMPEKVIKLENESRTTGENIRNALKLLGKDALVALVTADYHLESALMDCKEYGLKAYGVGAVTPEGPYREKVYAQAAFMKRMREERRAQAEKLGISMEEMDRRFMEERRAAHDRAIASGMTEEEFMQKSFAAMKQRLRDMGFDPSVMED